ncbi:hypothetical protein F4825DRAFT_168048 [Nemania diffusa]|nr:hypothetical protein F4825DRAFT_168048 [Nemania diffusa]
MYVQYLPTPDQPYPPYLQSRYIVSSRYSPLRVFGSTYHTLQHPSPRNPRAWGISISQNLLSRNFFFFFFFFFASSPLVMPRCARPVMFSQISPVFHPPVVARPARDPSSSLLWLPLSHLASPHSRCRCLCLSRGPGAPAWANKQTSKQPTRSYLANNTCDGYLPLYILEHGWQIRKKKKGSRSKSGKVARSRERSTSSLPATQAKSQKQCKQTNMPSPGAVIRAHA